AELVNRRSSISTRWRYTAIGAQRVDKRGGRQRGWECRSKLRSLNKCTGVSLLIIFQHSLPAGLIHNHSLSELLIVGQEIAETYGNRRTRQISERRFVEAIHQVAALLKFNRKEE